MFHYRQCLVDPIRDGMAICNTGVYCDPGRICYIVICNNNNKGNIRGSTRNSSVKGSNQVIIMMMIFIENVL